MELHPFGSNDPAPSPDPTKPNIEVLMGSVQKSLQEVGRMSPNWSIYRVPKRLRQVNADAYTPHLISIGPFHHDQPGLDDMREHKWRYMLFLLRRVGAHDPMGEPLSSCAHVILNVEREVRDWYAASIELSPEELAMVLLLDGCFMLELFFRCRDREPSVVQNDPVFLSEWMVPAIRRDLALLENQIPFFVLQRLFYVVVEHNAGIRADYLVYMALEFFRPALGPSVILDPRIAVGSHEYCKHLLDLLLKFHLPLSPRTQRQTVAKLGATSAGAVKTASIRSAHRTSLRNVNSLVKGGVVIKKAKTTNLSDFKFKNGELYIPPLHIYWWTESLLR